MGSTGKPDICTSRRLNSTDAEVTGLSIKGGWWVGVNAQGATSITGTGPGALYYGPESQRVADLEAHWAARAKPAKRTTVAERAPALVRVLRHKAHPRDSRRRIEELACGHEMVAMVLDRMATKRRCAQCEKEKS